MKKLLLTTAIACMTATATPAFAQLVIQPTFVESPPPPVVVAPYHHHFHNWEDFRQRRVHDEYWDHHH